MECLPKITEPDEELVHYRSHEISDQVTLCGLTDFLGSTPGEETDKPVTCSECKRIVGYIHRHRQPRGAKSW